VLYIPTLFMPSFYGDIQLEAVNEKTTKVLVERATPLEQNALTDLGLYAAKKGWLTPDGLKTSDGVYTLAAPLLKVKDELAKRLKPGRTLVTAVRFSDGGIAELALSSGGPGYKLLPEPAALDVPATSAAPAPALTPEVLPPKPAAKEPAVKAATTVAVPTQGCPEPDFVRAEIKARRVLFEFLTEEQREDFTKHNAFVSVGAMTGHHYMVTSRHARGRLEKYRRSLFDIDEDTPFCVHDWAVPAAEECLAIHLMLQLPQHEGYLRHLH
jgi:hypothetical protein